MQNLTTTLLDDIKNHREIILPAGKAKFNWVDISNIAEVAAKMLIDFDSYKNRAFDITGFENINFQEAISLINNQIQKTIKYRSVNPLHFYSLKKKRGMKSGMILVMIMLHFLPRFQAEPQILNTYKNLTGKNPTTLDKFIKRNKHLFD